MNRVKAIILSILISCLSSVLYGQASLGITSQGIIGLPDTIVLEDTSGFSVWVQNKGASSYTGGISILYAVSGDSTTPAVLDSSIFASSLTPGDSLEINLFMNFSNSKFQPGNNIIVIWPTGVAPTFDSAVTDIFIKDNCTAEFDYIISDDTVLDLNNLSISQADISYLWYFGDGQTDTVADPAMHIYPDVDTTYNVCLVISNAGCYDSVCEPVTINTKMDSNTYIINAKSGLITVMPNPFTNNIHINNKSNKIIEHVRIFSIIGSEVYNQFGYGLDEEVDLSHLKNGIYFLEITQKNGEKYIFNILKQ